MQVSWGAEVVTPQQQASGLVTGSQLQLNLRHYYSNQHSQRDTYLAVHNKDLMQPTRKRITWVQTAMLNYSSGYSQGWLGLGMDAALYTAVTLEHGHAALANGGDRVLVDSDGDAVKTWSRLGVGAVKLRIASTQFKLGRLLTENPILRYKDNRALPSSFQGIALNSNELDWLSVQAGSFQRAIPRTGAGSEHLTTTFGNRAYSGSSISYLGASAQVSHDLALSIYGSRFEDMWQQYYLGATHLAGESAELALKTSFNYYRTQDHGKQQLGFIDNHAYSLALTAKHAAHSLTAAWQQIIGNEYFDYVWESTGNYMANSLYSDYNSPNEKSWQTRYDLDFASYGVPGLSTSLWHAKGWNIDGSHYQGDRHGRNIGYNVRGLNGAKHNENGLMIAYAVQSGALKNTVFRSIIYNHRASSGQIDGSYDEFRLVANVPLDLF
ncbi:OprD family outer membrane porin [Pseudomonas sp. 5P_3.1_Bac2]|uniref:OprD family outer membrane porin n=1 Tax=Pseudomonas sp. 5P_3.1_Bac2 TaxID=2971617 RepID=UPI0029057031|nr:OprD family outer membrane porin [Pseudomonas sp. 5P_3.1_Bac2]